MAGLFDFLSSPGNGGGLLGLIDPNGSLSSQFLPTYGATGLEQDESQAARDAAALRIARGVRRPENAPPPSIFDQTGAVYQPAQAPIGFMGQAPGIMPMGQQPVAPPMQPTDAPATAGNIPLPQPRPNISNPAAFGPGMTQNAPGELGYQYGPGGEQAWQAAGAQGLPQNAQPAQYQPQQRSAPFMGDNPSAGVGDRLSAGFLGFTNAGGPMQALGNLVQGLATGQRTDPQGMALAQQKATFESLKDAGVPPNMAMAAAMNPEVLKQIAPEYFGGFKLVKIGNNPVTGEQYALQGPGGRMLDPITRQPLGQGGSATLGGGMLATGVKAYNPDLSGEDYINQFSPDVKAAVQAYIKGDVLPSGNPRQQAVATVAKTIAQRYGQEMGIPVSDALYSQRRTYRSQLGSNAPNSAGGQAKAFNQGIEHMSALADTLEKLDNWNGFGIPIIAEGANAIRQGMSNDQASIADKAAALGQTLAGEVGKLFSGSAGGGVHERQLTRERFSTVKSKPQLAAALEATLETMRGGLTALEQRRDEVMGPNSDIRFVNPETQKKIEEIEGVIARLKGNGPAPAKGSGSAGGIPQGWSVQVR